MPGHWQYFSTLPTLNLSANPSCVPISQSIANSISIQIRQASHHFFAHLHSHYQYMTLKPSPLEWHLIGRGHANTRPIRVTFPHLVKGTSTTGERPKCLNGGRFRQPIWSSTKRQSRWRHISSLQQQNIFNSKHSQSRATRSIPCQSNVNPIPIGGHLRK